MFKKMQDPSKADDNLRKFIENLQRVILQTNAILDRISSEDSDVAKRYSDIPPLLNMAKDALVNIGIDGQKKVIKVFIDKSIDVWYMIMNRDDRILTEHLSLILPGDDYVKKIQYLYGANDQRKCYVNEREINNVWKLLTALVHNSAKYVVFSDYEKFTSRLPKEVFNEWKVNFK